MKTITYHEYHQLRPLAITVSVAKQTRSVEDTTVQIFIASPIYRES